MEALVLRDVRPVPLAPTDAVPADPVDLVITGERVAAVGAGVAAPAGARVVDAEGRWVIPGLWDHHVHHGQVALAAQRLDLSAASSPEDVVRRVAARLADRPGEPVVAWGHRSALWSRAATVAELDAVAPDVPVVLISGDGHHAWLNTTALRALGLAVREDVVREDEWFDSYPRLPSVSGHTASPAAYRAVQESASARGVVGLVDFEFTGGAADWAERWAAGADLLRVRMATYAHGLEDVIAAGLRTGDPLPGGRGLTMGPLKVISDGSLNTRTAWCCEPYADTTGLEHPAGAPNLSGAELTELLRRAASHGLEGAVHAIGDAAVGQALDAFEAAGAGGSVEHAQLVAAGQVGRMAELGIRASVQPAHLLDDRDVTEQCWPDRAGRCFAFRSMLDAGVDLRLGSDAPVSPLDPWLAMAAAVHRSADERSPWHPEQALTVQEALAASTDGWGTVAPGHPADLVLLDDDPLAPVGDGAAVAAHLLAMPVAATYVGGRRVSGDVG